MRKFMIACGLLFLTTGSPRARENRGGRAIRQLSVAVQSGKRDVCQGGAGLFGAYLTSPAGVTGEFGACKVTGLPTGASALEMDHLFGPRMYFHSHGRMFPFVQALLGAERISAVVTGVGSGASNAFAMTAGGGADVTLTRHVSFRAIQVEYLYTHFGGASQNNLRLQSGIVWRIGR